MISDLLIPCMYIATTRFGTRLGTRTAIRPSLKFSTRQHVATMTRTDEIQSVLFARDPIPPLEPGTKVFDPSLTKDIAGLKDHKYVVAGELIFCARIHEGNSYPDHRTDAECDQSFTSQMTILSGVTL